MNKMFAALVGLGLANSAVPADAATVVFSGSRTNVDAPGPASARCGSRATANIRHNPPTSTSVGVSNFGAFTPTLSHCVQLPLSTTVPTPFDLGEFLFAFENGDTLTGTYSGTVTFLGPGLFSIVQTHIVTGGTGGLFGATGTFDSSGQVTFPGGRPTVQQSFSGRLNLPVPEPGTWMMMLLGFAAVGTVLRRSRKLEATGLPAAASL